MRSARKTGKAQVLMTLVALLAGLAMEAGARKLLVGPGKQYAKPSAAAAAVQNGDTVEIEAGVYESDAATWSADNLVLRGTAKYAHLKSNGVHAGGKGIWVIQGDNAVVENIEFSGAVVPDENGAGIRQEGSGVTIRNCYFHDNENGILGGNGDMLIEHTEFNHNGLGESGKTHNLYIIGGASLTFQYCYTHHAVIGHNLKSRAKKNLILYNRIMDEAEGTSSYDIDLPDGGHAVVLGNLIQQGPETDNATIVSYGAESMANAPNELFVASNTFVNDRPAGGAFIYAPAGTSVLKVYNNLFVGPGNPVSGKAPDSAGNVITSNPGFVNRAGFDFRITASSPAVDKGTPAGTAGTLSLAPAFEYIHPLSRQARAAQGALDAGAYEVGNGNPVKRRQGMRGGRAIGSGFRASNSGADGFFLAWPREPESFFNCRGESIRFHLTP